MIIILCLYKMLTLGEAEWGVFGNSVPFLKLWKLKWNIENFISDFKKDLANLHCTSANELIKFSANLCLMKVHLQQFSWRRKKSLSNEGIFKVIFGTHRILTLLETYYRHANWLTLMPKADALEWNINLKSACTRMMQIHACIQYIIIPV